MEEKTVDAELWEVKICESVLDGAHDNYQVIREVFIPSKNIACNIVGGYLNCFKTEKNRYFAKDEETKKIATLNLHQEFVNLLELQIITSKNIYYTVKDILKSHEKEK